MQNSIHHSDAVIDVLADVLAPRARKLTRTCFGITLQPARGRFAIGQVVFAPGIDSCSRMERAQVLAVGTRDDYPGVWCWLQGLGGRGTLSALVHERDLQPESFASTLQ